MNIGQYLKIKREEKGLSARAVAKKAGISDVHVSHIEHNRRNPTFDVIMGILKALEVDAKEFLVETGYTNGGKNKKTEKGQAIPVISWISAGAWKTVTDPYEPGDAEEWIESEVKGTNIFALKVKGHSMEPEFIDGEILVVNPHIETKPGDYVIAKNDDNNEATFKQLKRYGGTTILHPLNPKYPDIELKKRNGYRIIGKVVKKEKKY
ncbi:MAG: XRE family transcriptional regulator [Thermodesulfovibrionales bacterium]|nr:XRE family transcriptional regulator [Thermodesulfovibrionales bacterium]MDP3111759.1 XRE family transcriptional regulator [Thermodesulfovibrionales bacterium]